MKTLPLTKGAFAIVDENDYEFLSQWKWTAFVSREKIYAGRKEKGVLVLLHRIINETPEGLLTDHIDGNTLNNTRANLRTVTRSQNMMNRRGRTQGTSLFKGVWFCDGNANKKKWRCSICVDGKRKYLGRFMTEEEAGNAYREAELRIFGQYARQQKGGMT